MATNIATLDDLQRIKIEIVHDVLKEISSLISGLNLKPKKRMVKSSEAREMLGCSQSKLESLMRSGALPCTQIEGRGTLYFDVADLEKLFTKQYQTN